MTRHGTFLAGFVLGSLAVHGAEGWASELPAEPVDLFVAGMAGYHTFRIPAVVATPAGSVLAFCEGRRTGRGDAGDIDLVMRRSSDGGKSWSPLQVIWDDASNTCGNPAPVVDRATGRVWLALTWNEGTDTESQIMQGKSRHPRRVYMTDSADGGLTWAAPREMSGLRAPHWRWYATGPGQGIQLTRGQHAGRLLIPCNHSDHRDPSQHPYRAHVVYSDDGGETWELGGALEEKTNESTLVELAGGEILDNMRSYHGKNRRAVAISRDGGKSWGPVTLDQTLIEPVCQGSLLRVSWPGTANSKSRILFCNPASNVRENLTLRLSYDEGRTWPAARVLYSGTAAYSSLALLPDEKVAVLFERDNYGRITYVPVPVEWLEN